MSDFLTDLLADDGPVAREVEFNGKKGTVYFRRITGAEQAQLVAGQKVQVGGKRKGKDDDGAGNTMEMDLGRLVENQQKLVWFSVCKEDGTKFFRTFGDVQKLSKDKLAVLHKHAEEVNKDEDDGGKA